MPSAHEANNWTKVQEECRAKNGEAQHARSARVTVKLQRII